MEGNRNWVLFGLDLRRVAEAWLAGWREWRLALRVPAWLAPGVPVSVSFPDGSVSAWTVDGTSQPGIRPDDRVRAVCLSDDIVLTRQIDLPLLSKQETESAVSLAVSASSPFGAEETVWGYRLEGGSGSESMMRAELAIARRSAVSRALALQFGGDGQASTSPEVWVRSGGAFIVMRGYGEALRQSMERRHWKGVLTLSGATLGLVLVLLATPLIQANLQVREANQRFSALAAVVAPDVAARDALLHHVRQGEAVSRHFSPRLDALTLIERLSVLVPDGAHLTRLQIDRDGTVMIAGLAENAAGLVDILGREGGFANVRTQSAIARDAASNLETFSISFSLAGQGGR